MGIIRTGKYLDPAERERLHELYAYARRTPAIVLSQRHLGPKGKSEAEIAMNRCNEEINKACVAIGCAAPKEYIDEDGDPAIVNYGVDFTTGEVLEWDGK